MHKSFFWLGPPLLAAGIFLFAVTGDFRAQDTQSKAADQHNRDRTVRNFLYEATVKGVTVYNKQRDYAACARIYGNALLAVVPLLDHHPNLQKQISAGLASARQNTSAWKEAMALRKVIDEVRTQLVKAGPAAQTDKRFDQDVKPLRDTVKPRDFKPADKADAVKPRDKTKVDVARPRDKDKVKSDAVKPRDKNTVDVSKPRDKDKVKSDVVRPRAKDRPILDKQIIGPERDKGKTAVGPKGKGPNPNEATISGRVTYKGKPLTSGFVTLVDANGRKFSASIKADGTYRFQNVTVPPGMYRVAIDSSVTLGKGQQRGVAIPQRYRNPQTSGISEQINRGPNLFDIALQD